MVRALLLLVGLLSAGCASAGFVYRCEADGEVVAERDRHVDDSDHWTTCTHGRHVTERKPDGAPLTLCGCVHPAVVEQ